MMRQRIKTKVERNEEEMKRRKKNLQKSLNPTSILLKPSREYTKKVENPANWSSLPPKPRYSKIDPKLRVYGKRFEVWEKNLVANLKMPEEYEEARRKMIESISDLRKEILERSQGSRSKKIT